MDVRKLSLSGKIQQGFRLLGLRGLGKSIYFSKKYTGTLDSLFVHSKVITDISPDTSFDIDDRFIVGIGDPGATSPRIGRSKFSTEPGSSISQSGTGPARIGPASIVHIEGDFHMGDSYVNSHARIICGDEISIGDDVAIGWNFELLDDDRHQIVVEGERPPQTAPIEIQDGVWIGHDVSIHKGVTVHEGSVVASDSVVVADVPPNTLVAGSPAKVIRENVDWEP